MSADKIYGNNNLKLQIWKWTKLIRNVWKSIQNNHYNYINCTIKAMALKTAIKSHPFQARARISFYVFRSIYAIRLMEMTKCFLAFVLFVGGMWVIYSFIELIFSLMLRHIWDMFLYICLESFTLWRFHWSIKRIEFHRIWL